MPVYFNASNEEAVFAYLRNEIKLYDIYGIISEQMESFNPIQSPSLDDILNIDEEVRIKTREFMKRIATV